METPETASPVTLCHNLKELNLHAVVHVNVMYIAEVAAVCIFEYFFPITHSTETPGHQAKA